MSNEKIHEFVAALYPSYQAAHQAVQHLYDQGYNQFTVTYVEAKFDQTNDGEGGFFPDHTPDIQIPVEHSATDIAEQEVPQISALSNGSSSRTSPSLHQRLDMIGIPEAYTKGYLDALVHSGQALAVIRGDEEITNLLSGLAGTSAVSIRTFPSVGM